MPFSPTTYEGLDRIQHIEKYVLSHDLALAGGVGILPSGDTSGITDAAAISAALTTGFLNATPVLLGPGTFYIGTPIIMPGSNMVVRGAGRRLTTLKRAASTVGTVITNDACDGTLFEGFNIDAAFSTIPTNANHGLRIFDSSNVTCKNLGFRDYKGSAILCFVTTPNTKFGVIFDTCDCDAISTGGNGFLIVDMDESGMRHCIAKNAVNTGAGPGYGLQLKNQCRFSFIDDCYANNCVGGFAFGNDTASAPSVSESRITGGVAVNCTSGVFGGYYDHCEVSDLVIVQQAGNNEAIRVQGSANNNTFLGISVVGTPSPKGIVRFDDTCNNNFVELDMVDSSAGGLGEFENTSSNNQVVVRRTGTSRPASDKIGTSTGTGNSVWVHKQPHDQIRLAVAENFLTETFDRMHGNTGTAMVSGTAYFTRLAVRSGTVLTNVQIIVTTLGAGITLSKVGIYKKDGTQLAVSADQGTNWQSVGLKSIALTAPYTTPADDVLYVCFLCVFSTTAPQLLGVGSIGNRNGATSGGIVPYGAMGAQVDLPTPATISSSNGLGFWAGIS